MNAVAAKARSQRYRKLHGEPAQVFARDDLSIEAFAFDFSPGDDEDPGYVLFTNGMSDRRMHVDEEAADALAAGEIKARAELAWYVRDLDESYVDSLAWLAEFPFIDHTWLGFGHTVIMPFPIVPGSELVAYLVLVPIVRAHQKLFSRLRVDGDPVELLVVHLLTRPEYDLKREKGVNAILDLFDEHSYPLVLDPERASMV